MIKAYNYYRDEEAKEHCEKAGGYGKAASSHEG
jgi:hypothetical protein